MSSTVATDPAAPDPSGGGGATAPTAKVQAPMLVLIVVLTATFMQLRDISIVSVAVGSIQSTLHASYPDVQLVPHALRATSAGAQGRHRVSVKVIAIIY